jgi:hypothetical protein
VSSEGTAASGGLTREQARQQLAAAIVDLAGTGTETLADDIHGAFLEAGRTLARAAGSPPVIRMEAMARALVARDLRSRRIETFALFVMEPDLGNL